MPILLAALALPGSAAAAPPKLPSDAAAMTAVAQGAVKVERCRSKAAEYDYTRCDSPAEIKLPRGVQVEASTPTSYTLAARSRQGRRFVIDRAQGALTATCTPAGRGRCGPAGTWRPKPKPVMSPRWGEEWLEYERAMVGRLLAVVNLIERCGAAGGDFTPCRTAEVDALAGAHYIPFSITLEPRSYVIHAISPGMTEFLYERREDGTVDRSCRFSMPRVSPCDGERW